jgi:O-acetyl-ADP-ribose deacetylase (regulator of RNase III)
MPVDALVRPANTRLEPLLPALRQLDRAAGPKFLEQIRVNRELGVGAAVVTGAGDLPAEFVIHLILGSAPDTVTTDSVRRAAEAAMFQCGQWQLSTLASPIPAVGNLAPEAAADALVQVAQAHMRKASHPSTLLLVTTTAAEAESLNARIAEGRA